MGEKSPSFKYLCCAYPKAFIINKSYNVMSAKWAIKYLDILKVSNGNFANNPLSSNPKYGNNLSSNVILTKFFLKSRSSERKADIDTGIQ